MPRPRLILIRNGHLIDPGQGIDAPMDLLITDGKVTEVLPPGEPLEDAYRVEAGGQIVAPGFVDLHTHLRYPGFPDKETIETGTAAAAAGGFTTVCAMANTDPVVDDVAVLREVLAREHDEARVRAYQLAAVSMGLRGERLTDMEALAAAGAVAFSDDGKPIGDAGIMRSALQQSAILGKVISVHEEAPDRAGVANAGETARSLGLREWPCADEAAMVARDIGLLEETGGHLHIAHVSCAQTVDLIRQAKGRGLPVTAEVTPHHLALTDELLPSAGSQAKVNPPLRTRADTAALVEALADGTIDSVATDHAPHTRADKERPFAEAAFGFTSLETALPLLLELVRGGRIVLATLIERMTVAPAQIFGLDAGTLRPGAPADLCIFDPEARWPLTPDALESKGKNSPILGASLQGRVSCTMVAGQIVHVQGV